MIVLTPFFGGKLVPNTVKIGLGIMVTMLVYPMARPLISMENVVPQAIPFILLMLKETFIGTAIGFVNSHLFYALEMAGRIIDTARGSSMAEVQDPHQKTRATPFGDLFMQMMLVIFVVMGGHHIFLEAYLLSYQSIPPDLPMLLPSEMTALIEHFLRITAKVIYLGALIASPVLAATLISDIVFGILNRVAPQLNAYFMSMPVKAMGGCIMVFIIIEPLYQRMQSYAVCGFLERSKTRSFCSDRPPKTYMCVSSARIRSVPRGPSLLP